MACNIRVGDVRNDKGGGHRVVTEVGPFSVHYLLNGIPFRAYLTEMLHWVTIGHIRHIPSRVHLPEGL